ncbi:sugar ABC transporter ATP-binding protein [Christensenella tenuis]|uniref:Sugar ABC transporter ATP-binding protein n=1 Tax=Christensenella tenuis TaxID=2763033 RepID=A0ABR7EFZ0_9FIRM|nr:sugar ABC transporter ATP-binding protein [Christensenella tenuis]MBC5648660.1 sugar ABC transporter ATP-binding protein [Christensenella tenuis]
MSNRAIIQLSHITKQYPGVVALDDISLEIREGEILALAGENGAGKSTLIKTIAGAITPSSGTIGINNREYGSLSPAQAREAGVSVIYQEFNLVNELSVTDNIFLGEYKMKGLVLDKKAMRRKTEEVFRQLDIHISPDTLVKDLSVAYQQMVEIAKAIAKNAKILIMDEPSAPLTGQEVENMFRVVSTLKKAGVTFIYITHRLEEIFRISDRIAVMRDGKLITVRNTKDINEDELVRLMIGRELTGTYPKHEMKETDDIVLKIDGLTGNGLKDISLEVRKGEILGIGGLVGAGRTELAEMLFGIVHPERGSIAVNGKPVSIQKPLDAIRSGIALVPEDRKRHGALLHLSIQQNISIPSLPGLSKMTFIHSGREQKLVDQYMKALRIKAPDSRQLVKNLSGGNQQKVVLAKWLAMEPDLILFDEPTRGIDIGAKFEIYQIMTELVKKGKAIIMISSEMPELIGMSDRIVILRNGRLTGYLKKGEFDQEQIMRYASLS